MTFLSGIAIPGSTALHGLSRMVLSGVGAVRALLRHRRYRTSQPGAAGHRMPIDDLGEDNQLI